MTTPISISDKITGDLLTAAEFMQLIDALLKGTKGITPEYVTCLGEIASPKVKFTADGGLAVKLTNKTGSASIKGYVLELSSTVDNAVKLYDIDVPDAMGVFLDSDVADGDEAWIVVSGIADVYFSASTTRGYLARIGFTTDTGEVAGQAIAEPYPTSPFATDKHFAEIGHVLENRTGAGLAKCILHFN